MGRHANNEPVSIPIDRWDDRTLRTHVNLCDDEHRTLQTLLADELRLARSGRENKLRKARAEQEQLGRDLGRAKLVLAMAGPESAKVIRQQRVAGLEGKLGVVIAEIARLEKEPAPKARPDLLDALTELSRRRTELVAEQERRARAAEAGGLAGGVRPW